LHQSPTGHLNQIHKANGRQIQHVVSQFLQIIHKDVEICPIPGHHKAKWRQLKTLAPFFYCIINKCNFDPYRFFKKPLPSKKGSYSIIYSCSTAAKN